MPPSDRLFIVLCFWLAPISCALAQSGFDPTDPEPIDEVSIVAPYSGFGFSPYGPGINTFGFAGRVESNNLVRGATVAELANVNPQAASDAAARVLSAGSLREDPSQTNGVNIVESINHQPLIHIKVRVIEVQRADALSVASVLDYISTKKDTAPISDFGAGFKNSLTDGRENVVGASRFGAAGLIGVNNQALNNGGGLLLNLTSEHINYLASLLTTELNGDVITSPQVTTLNGKNVIFRAGDKIPFVLGRNVVTGGTNNVQQFFYKHVGTYISVTPQIVNWGPNHEGRGRVRAAYENPDELEAALIQPGDIEQGNIRAVLYHMAADPELRQRVTPKFRAEVLDNLPTPALTGLTFPSNEYEQALMSRSIDQLNALVGFQGLTRSDLSRRLGGLVAMPSSSVECAPCDWRPEDCTINLNIAVRLSNVGNVQITTQTNSTTNEIDVVQTDATTEQDVRAISNVVQVKSGHGVVMAGLIGMQDLESVAKVPVLGDIPVVGFLFRSKESRKVKTETVIFVEAQVLPDNAEGARHLTAEDLCNGKQHLNCDLCNTDLHRGLARAGLATGYLPHPSPAEQEYWHYYHREMCLKNCRQIHSQVREAAE